MTEHEFAMQVSPEIDTVPVPGVAKDQVNNPVGVELSSVTVAVQEVVAPTATVLGVHVTRVEVIAGVIVNESDPEVAE